LWVHFFPSAAATSAESFFFDDVYRAGYSLRKSSSRPFLQRAGLLFLQLELSLCALFFPGARTIRQFVFFNCVRCSIRLSGAENVSCHSSIPPPTLDFRFFNALQTGFLKASLLECRGVDPSLFSSSISCFVPSSSPFRMYLPGCAFPLSAPFEGVKLCRVIFEMCRSILRCPPLPPLLPRRASFCVSSRRIALVKKINSEP